MGFIVDIVNDFGIARGIILILLIGLAFAYFVIWRLSKIVDTINKVEDTARREIMAVTKESAKNSGQLEVINKIVIRHKEKE
jgi:hypothetical protein